MSITIHPDLETRLRAAAQAQGLTLEAYVERLVRADQEANAAETEFEALALEGFNSGEPAEVGPGYWEEKHRRLDENLKKNAHR